MTTPEEDPQTKNPPETAGESSPFRKISLERLSSPEQLDKLMVIVGPKGWVSLICVIVLLITVVIWSFIGKIPVQAVGTAVLLNEQGVFAIQPEIDGTVTDLFVAEGEKVKAGQLIAKVFNSNVEIQLNNAIAQVASLQEQLAAYEGFLDEESKAQQDAIESEVNALEFTVQQQKGDLAFLEQDLKDKEAVLKKGLIPQATVEQARQALAAKKIAMEETQAKINQTVSAITQLPQLAERQTRRLQLSQAEDQLKVLQAQTAQQAVTAVDDGTILGIWVGRGTVVQRGQSIAIAEHGAEPGQGEIFFCFLPPEVGQRVTVGMQARIDIDYLQKENYGSILGKVIAVHPWPMSDQRAMKLFQNEQMIQYLFANYHSLIMVQVRPDPDPTNATGYRWSSKIAPDKPIMPSTLGHTKIVLLDRSPISYLIQLKSYLQPKKAEKKGLSNG